MNHLINKAIFLVLQNKKMTAIGLIALINWACKQYGVEIPNDTVRQLVDAVINTTAALALILARNPNNTAEPTVALTGSAFEDKDNG
jgi:hypothetical protein